MSRSVLLLEFKFHQEIIPSQIKFLLSSGDNVHLFLDEALWDEALFGCFRGLISINLYRGTRKWYNKLRLFFAIRQYLGRHNITHLVINTLDSRFASFIVNGFPHLQKIGIAHRMHDIRTNNTYRKNVRRMDGVLTLSKHTFEYLVENYSWVTNPSWFYPIFYCQQPTDAIRKQELRIVVPGQLSKQRRAYDSLIECARTLKEKSELVTFVLLGNATEFDGPDIARSVSKFGLEDYFVRWNEFVPYATFIEELQRGDYVMPLLAPEIGNASNYQHSQITAALNWALAFQRKVILHEAYSNLDAVAGNAVSYNTATLVDVILDLRRGDRSGYQFVPELQFEYQKNQYLKSFNR